MDGLSALRVPPWLPAKINNLEVTLLYKAKTAKEADKNIFLNHI